MAALERFRMSVFRAREDAEMDEELRFHLEMETEENIRRGMTPAEARRRARIAFGGMEGHRDSLRAGRRWPALEDAWLDLRYAARSLLRAPGFATAIVLALGLGIGTSVAVLGGVRHLVTQAVPFPEPGRLFSVELRDSRGIGSLPAWEDFRAWHVGAGATASLAAFVYRGAAIGDGDHTTYGTSFRVSGDFFPTLGGAALHGRLFTSEDHRPGSPPVVVVAEGLWSRWFGADPGLVGGVVHVDGLPHTVVGIVPRGFQFPAVADFWMPLLEEDAGPDLLRVGVIGRLREGAGSEEVRLSLETVQARLDSGRPEGERARRVELLPLAGRNADRAETAVLLVRAAALLVFLVGIANGAGLMLTRGMLRRREIAVRRALGAGCYRVVRHLVAESALLAGAGGMLGLGVGWLMVELLQAGTPASMTRQMLGWERLRIDGHAVVLAAGLAAAAAIACGLFAGLHAARGDPSGGLREDGNATSGGRSGGRVTRILLVGEVASSLTLVLLAALLTRSLVELLRADPGYDAGGVWTAQWVLPPSGYTEAGAVEDFQERLLERVRSAIPGTAHAAIVSHLPTAPFGTVGRYRVAGSDPDADALAAAWRPITPDYLDVMGIPLLWGRPFGDEDRPPAPLVTIVDESLAAGLGVDGADVLGTRLEVDGESRLVVGVVRTVQNPVFPGALRRTLYVPQSQVPTRAGFLVARAQGDPPGLARALQEAIWDLDPRIAIGETATMRQIASDLRWPQRIMAVSIALFALIALAITVISLHALVAHAVARRYREFGIRLTLGASPARILREALLQGMAWTGVGTLLGLLLSAGAARLARRLLYGVQPMDPVSFTLVPVGLLLLAFLACYLPARRAARVDPVVSLRE